jgi:5-methylcytosine-specific restriction protein A
VGGGDVAREFAERFYKSKVWQDCRDAYFIYRYGLCERCGGPGKIVHHKVYLTPENINDPNITLSWSCLELICQDCHNKEHMGGDVTAEGLRFNEDGELVVDNPK